MGPAAPRARTAAGRRYVLDRVRASVDALGAPGRRPRHGDSWRWPALIWVVAVADHVCPWASVWCWRPARAARRARGWPTARRARLSRWGPRSSVRSRLPAGLARRPTGFRGPAPSSVGCPAHATYGFALGFDRPELARCTRFEDLTFPPVVVAGAGRARRSRRVVLAGAQPGRRASVVALLGVGWLAVVVGLAPGVGRGYRPWLGRRLLTPSADADLVAARRATDRHARPRRWTPTPAEPAPHRNDRCTTGHRTGWVAVNVLLGAARRALARDPADAGAILDRAQDAAEQAAGRACVRSCAESCRRSLDDRGLAGALAGLAASSGVPCRVDVDVPGRCAGLRRGDRLLRGGRSPHPTSPSTARPPAVHRHRPPRARPACCCGVHDGRPAAGAVESRGFRAHRHPPAGRGRTTAQFLLTSPPGGPDDNARGACHADRDRRGRLAAPRGPGAVCSAPSRSTWSPPPTRRTPFLARRGQVTSRDVANRGCPDAAERTPTRASSPRWFEARRRRPGLGRNWSSPRYVGTRPSPPSCSPAGAAGLGYLLKETRRPGSRSSLGALHRVADGGYGHRPPRWSAQLAEPVPVRTVPLERLSPRESDVLGVDGAGPGQTPRSRDRVVRHRGRGCTSISAASSPSWILAPSDSAEPNGSPRCCGTWRTRSGAADPWLSSARRRRTRRRSALVAGPIAIHAGEDYPGSVASVAVDVERS